LVEILSSSKPQRPGSVGKIFDVQVEAVCAASPPDELVSIHQNRPYFVYFFFLSFSTVNEVSKVISRLIENGSGQQQKPKKVVQQSFCFFSVFCIPALIVRIPQNRSTGTSGGSCIAASITTKHYYSRGTTSEPEALFIFGCISIPKAANCL